MTSALQESSKTPGLLEIPGCEFTPVSLTLPADLSFDHWERIGRQLQLADMAVQWWIGDWLVYGEHKWREKYAQAIELTGKREQTLINYHNVAKSIESNRRRVKLSFSIHAEVASLDEDDQERILAKAAGEPRPTVRGVRREADKARRAKMPKVPDDAMLLSKESREFLDDYMGSIAEWTEKVPDGIPIREREALDKLLYAHGEQALWLRSLTRGAEFKAITELFSFEEGGPSIETAEGNHIFKYLDKSGYFLGEDELLTVLDSMAEKELLQVLSTEEARQDGRRGGMNDLYGLHPRYANKIESDRLKKAARSLV